MAEQPLGGGQTHGIVRIGATVRRPLHSRSGYVHALLRHLEHAGFDGAPRFLGIDEHGREILTFIDGEVPAWSPLELSDARLGSAAQLIRRFHDATAGSALASVEEVVCHRDLGAHNIVFDGETAVGLIDWDEHVGPGPRLFDLADACWSFADVSAETLTISDEARRTRLICDTHGWHDRHAHHRRDRTPNPRRNRRPRTARPSRSGRRLPTLRELDVPQCGRAQVSSLDTPDREPRPPASASLPPSRVGCRSRLIQDIAGDARHRGETDEPAAGVGADPPSWAN